MNCISSEPARLVFLFVLLMGLLAPKTGTSQEVTRPKIRPNILIILADDMGYGDLGCYGSRQIPTPFLDRLAANGVRCTQGYVSGNVCAPSRAGLLTGRYQQHFGFEHNLGGGKQRHHVATQLGIPIDQPTIADRLKDLGYRTGLIGKWHVGQAVPEMLPNAKGFDYFFGMRNGSHPYFPTARKNHLFRNDEPVRTIDVPYLTDWFTEDAIRFVQQETESPWFLFLSYNTPHTPLQAKPEDLAAMEYIPHKKRRTYAAMQSCMDQNIGRLLDSLRSTEQLDNTLIVFFSDNGGSVTASHACNAPLNGMKGSFLEGGIRVPFLFHWPAGLPAGITFDKPFISLDLLPTFLAAAGDPKLIELKNGGQRTGVNSMDGVNLLPSLRSPNQPLPQRDLFWRMALRGAAVRSGDWKLIRCVHTPPMLFNLAEDPSEQNNLYQQHPDKVEQLWDRLNAWEYSLQDTPHWFEAVRWQEYNHELYHRPYNLTQPARDQWPTPWDDESRPQGTGHLFDPTSPNRSSQTDDLKPENRANNPADTDQY